MSEQIKLAAIAKEIVIAVEQEMNNNGQHRFRFKSVTKNDADFYLRITSVLPPVREAKYIQIAFAPDVLFELLVLARQGDLERKTLRLIEYAQAIANHLDAYIQQLEQDGDEFR